MALLKRHQPKAAEPPAPAAFTVDVELCDRGCGSVPTHHISWDVPVIGRTHRFLCDMHYEMWQFRQGAKQQKG